MDQNIKKIHNAVFVSDKILTYKIAAAILETDANEAKKVLEKYVNDMKNNIIHVSYVVGGITQENTHKIKLVPKVKYDKTKLLFKTITIDHIYSIQKSPPLDWSSIANVNDFLYDKYNVKEAKPIKQQEIETPQQTNKKSTLTNFLSNSQKKTEKVVTSKNKIQEKSGVLNTFLKKNNKENISTTNKNDEKNKTSSSQKSNDAFTNFFTNNKQNKSQTKKEESDDEEIIQVNKKRTRVINDEDDDDDTPSKCPKTDILGDSEEEYQSDQDLFGSPEKDQELMQESQPVETKTENNTETTDNQSVTIENNTETTDNQSETTENNTETTEDSDILYQDDQGYFVTEKKKIGKKQEKQLTKKQKEDMKKVEKEENKIRKEVAKKIKTNTNQRTLFNFFQKK